MRSKLMLSDVYEMRNYYYENGGGSGTRIPRSMMKLGNSNPTPVHHLVLLRSDHGPPLPTRLCSIAFQLTTV